MDTSCPPHNLMPCTWWALSKYLGQIASEGRELASQTQRNEGITAWGMGLAGITGCWGF